MNDPRDNLNVTKADAAECVNEIIDKLGINQVLFSVAEAIGHRAADMEESATRAMLDELSLGVEILAIRAQRAAL